jgi:hypothetical protein
MSLQVLLMILGSLAGLISCILGVMALSHPSSESSLTTLDRNVGWSLLWWLERKKYDPYGQRLCTFGGITFCFGVACWVVWYASK